MHGPGSCRGGGGFVKEVGSRDQVGCLRSLQEDQNPGIQASLASPAVRMPSRCSRARGANGRRLGLRTAGDGWAPLEPWILVFLEAAIAVDLITASKSF